MSMRLLGSRRAWMAALALVLAAVVLDLWLRQFVFGPPFGGLSRSAAIARAEASIEPAGSPHQLVSADWGRCGALLRGYIACPPSRWVWSVRFSGDFGVPLEGPAGSLNPVTPHNRTEVIWLDYFTGKWISMEQTTGTSP